MRGRSRPISFDVTERPAITVDASAGKSPDTDGDYLEPTRAQRLRVLATWAVAFAAWLAMKLYWHGFMDWIGDKPICEQVPWLQGLIVVSGLLGALIVWTLARRAWRLHKHGQSPPPGTPVFFRTRVRRGPAVQIDAYLLVFFAMALAAGMVLLASTQTVRTMMVESRVLCGGP